MISTLIPGSSLLGLDCEEAWWAELKRLCLSYGFEKIIFAVSSQARDELNPNKIFLKSTYPEKWRFKYDSEHFYDRDITVRHAESSRFPLIWDKSFFLTPPECEFYEEAKLYGMGRGIVLPIRSGNVWGMLCAAFDDAHAHKVFERYYCEHIAPLLAIRDFAIESILKIKMDFFNDSVGSIQKLTIRELECLKWTVQGKTSWEISRILGCSEATVNFHMSNVRKKLNVGTRREAVVLALKHGLI